MKINSAAPSCKMTTIGGQALLEGIMMKGPHRTCIVVRKPDGELAIKEEDVEPLSKKYKVCGWPVVRGAVNLFMALKDGIQAINYSAQFIEEDGEEEKPSRFELWLDKHFKQETVEKVVMGIAVALGIAMPVALFILLPTLLVSVLPKDTAPMIRNLLEGLVRIIIFLTYMWSVSHMKDIRRTFEYHGAEHKTIFCYESGDDLTVENVRQQGRYHPRCGTSFLFVVMIISILVFSFVSSANPWFRMAMRIILLPVVVGLSYELNRFAGRHDNLLTKALRWPGIQLQHLTVFEPDDSMIEVAIEGMKRVIPDDGSDQW